MGILSDSISTDARRLDRFATLNQRRKFGATSLTIGEPRKLTAPFIADSAALLA